LGEGVVGRSGLPRRRAGAGIPPDRHPGGPRGPGYERFREQEERPTFGIAQEIVSTVLSSSTYELEDSMMATFSRVFFGAMSTAGSSVSEAKDPRKANAQAETAIAFILRGLQSLADSGVRLPDPEVNGADSG